jgi:hypothetical protein
MITIEVTGTEDVIYTMNKLGEDLPTWLGRIGAMGEIGKTIQRRARLYCPRWTRKLWNSINVIPVGERDLMITMGEGVPYAYYQEFGFSPHYIPGAIGTRTGGVFANWLQQKRNIPFALGYGAVFSVGKAYNNEGYILGRALYTTDRDMIPILDKYCNKVFDGLRT